MAYGQIAVELEKKRSTSKIHKKVVLQHLPPSLLFLFGSPIPLPLQGARWYFIIGFIEGRKASTRLSDY